MYDSSHRSRAALSPRVGAGSQKPTVLHKSAFVLALLASSVVTAEAVPMKIPYAGLLTYENGVNYSPEDGNVSITAALYLAPTGGEPAWGPVAYPDVEVVAGIVAFVLDGDAVPAVLGGVPLPLSALFSATSTLYLELGVDGTALAPRQAVLAVPFALAAGDASTVGGLSAAELATVADLEALTAAGLGAAPAAHTHAAADIVSGVLAPERIPAGTDSTKLPLAGGALSGPLSLGWHPPGQLRFESGNTAPNACTPQRVGYAYFDTGLQILMICNGSGFVPAASTQPPFTPNAFAFPNVSGAALSSVITSAPVTLTGPGTGPVSAFCTGCTFEVNGSGTFVSSQSGLVSGNSVRLRTTAAATSLTTTSSTLTVGSVTSAPWTVTTVAGPFSFSAEVLTSATHSINYVSAVALSDTKFLVVYWQNDEDLWGVVANINAGALTFATPTLLADANVAAYGGYHQRSIAPFDANTAVIFYKQYVSATSFNHIATARPVLVSGNTLTVGNAAATWGSLNAYRTEIFRMSGNDYVVYSDGITAGYDGGVGRVTFDGTSFSNVASFMHDPVDAVYGMLPFPAENRYALYRGSVFYTGAVGPSSLTQVGTGTSSADTLSQAYGVSIGPGRAVRVSGNKLVLYNLSGDTVTEHPNAMTLTSMPSAFYNGMASVSGNTLYLSIGRDVAAINVSAATPSGWTIERQGAVSAGSGQGFPVAVPGFLAVFYRNAAGRLAGMLAAN
jgi:hypothetical protein